MDTLVAISPGDLAPAQKTLTEWIDGRLAALTEEHKAVTADFEYARAHKWRTGPLASQIKKLERRQLFYAKLKTVVELGYVIMPSLPMDVIAIRTKAKAPRPDESTYRQTFPQVAQALPEGEGEYKHPVPTTESYEQKRSDGKMEDIYYPVEFEEEFAMPVALLKPQILERTQEAMALKIFDEIGVVRDHQQSRGDPIVVGTLIDRTRGYGGRRFSFFIAWALPLSDL